MEIQNKKLDEGVFMQERQEVLGQWPTGKDVDLQEAADYQKRLSPERVFSTKLLEAKKAGRTLIQPRAGVPVIEEHIKLMQYLEKEGEADLLPTTIDSYTRQNRYAEAEDGIQESIRLGRAMLNGFPAVNHGVAGCRRVIESVHTPLQVRHGTPDARLLTEIAYAGGFTSYEGGGISYNLPYCKNVPMETTIRSWQYVDRLTGLYEEMGISINREPYGPLTGTLVPPCISHAAAIIEALLAAEQGVRNITVGYGQCGNIVQDIAAIRTLEELTEEYLHKYGYDQDLHGQPDRRALQSHKGHRKKPARSDRDPDDGGKCAGAPLHKAGRQYDGRPDISKFASGRGNGDHPPGDALYCRQML